MVWVTLLHFVTTKEATMNIRYLRSTQDSDYKHNAEATIAITCCDDEIKACVSKWAGSEGWSLHDFSMIAELLGFTLPISLNEWNSEEKSFTMRSKSKVARIKLRLGDGMDYFSEVEVSEKGRIERYSVFSRDRVFHAMLESQIEEKAGKTLKSSYATSFCSRTLELPNGYQLYFNVTEPGGGSFEETNAKVFEECDKINQYLFGIPKKCDDLDVTLVFSNLMDLYKFSSEDIASAEQIRLQFTDPKGYTKSEKLLQNGKCVRFVETIRNGTYEVCADGNWSYETDEISISYDSDEKKGRKYKVCLTGDDICAFCMSTDELVQIEQKCLELKHKHIDK